MTPEEKQRLDWLCKEIQIEKDQAKFNALVREMNEIISRKKFRLDDPDNPARQN